MSEKKEPGGIYTAGYHGTSVELAMQIAQTGFDATAGTVVFSPLHDIRSAMHRGVDKSAGQPEFAIVHAQIPPTELTDSGDSYELLVSPEVLADIRIIRVMAWQMRRNAGIPPRALYDEHPYISPEW